jgi:hypothetical protein
MFLFRPQLVQDEKQQQPRRKQSLSNDGAADVPQPLQPQPQAIATPYLSLPTPTFHRNFQNLQ